MTSRWIAKQLLKGWMHAAGELSKVTLACSCTDPNCRRVAPMRLSILALLWLISCATSAMCQGVFIFSNYVPSFGVDAPVYDLFSLRPLQGAGYAAQLYYSSTPQGHFVAAGIPVLFTNPRGPGYFGSNNGPLVQIPDVDFGRSSWLQIRVWNLAAGSTYEDAALRSGAGYGGSAIEYNQGGTKESPAPLIGFQSWSIIDIPEPRSTLLLVCGLPLFWAVRGFARNRY